MCETSDAGEEDQDPLNLARTTATSVFEEADVDRNGKITLNEFRAWASQSDSSASKIDNLRKTAVRRMSMNSLRSLTHLNAYPVRVAFTAFANHADEHGLITRSEFVKCLKSLSRDEDDDDESRLVAFTSLYDIFDIDSNGVVDLNELSSGLGILCGGTASDKAAASFELYDVNGDGLITYDEMVVLLTSVFRIMYHILGNN